MEDFSKNTTQQKSKTKLRLALLIIWIVICTALLMYFLVQNSIFISSHISEIADWSRAEKNEANGQEFTNAVIKTCVDSIIFLTISLVFAILLYASFMILIIHKLVCIIRSLRIEHRSDIPPQ